MCRSENLSCEKLWTDQDPYGGRPAFTGRTVPDAAAVIEAATASDR